MNSPDGFAANTPTVLINEKYDPVLYAALRLAPGKRDFELIAGYFEQVIDEGRRTALLCDLRDTTRLRLLETTRFWLPWATRHKKRIDALSSGTAFVSNNHVVVKVVNALLKVMPLASPMKVFANAEEGLAWVLTIAEQDGLTPAERPTLSKLAGR